MNYLKRNLILLFIIVGNLLFAQQTKIKQFQLNWVDNVDFTINKNLKIKTSLVEGNLIDGNFNPTYTSSWDIENNMNLSIIIPICTELTTFLKR